MYTATKGIQNFLVSVVEYESRRGVRSIKNTEIALRICEKLRLHLSQIFGNSGYHALISRALAFLIKNQANHWVGQLALGKNGTLVPADLDATQKRASADGESVDLPSQLLVTLATLIGETLTLNIARDVWPMIQEKETENQPATP